MCEPRRATRRVTAAIVVAIFVLCVPGIAVGESESLAFARKESQRRGPTERPYAAMATSRPELRDLWNHFNQRGDLPIIRFKRNVAILAALGGSGSCGVRLHDLRLNREKKLLVARLYQVDPGGGAVCTDDLVLYTFTVAVRRADLNPLRPDDLQVRRRQIADPDPG